MKRSIYDIAAYFNQEEGRKYPCSNQIVCCAYITDNLLEVYDYLNKNNIAPIRQSKTHIEWQENNEQWIWISTNHNASKGYRLYKVKISKDYNNKEMLERVIIPCCDLYCCSWEVME